MIKKPKIHVIIPLCGLYGHFIFTFWRELMLKTFLTPLILFSAFLLTACGGGGGGGGSATATIPNDVPSGVSSAVTNNGNSFDALSLRNAYTADTSNGFLMFVAGDDGPFSVNGSQNYYTAVSSLPSSSGTIMQDEYQVANNIVTNAFSVSYGTPIATGVQVTLVEDNTPANQIIIETVNDNTFKRVGQSNIDFTGFSLYVYQGRYTLTVTTGTNNPVTMTNTVTKNVPFLAATYAALIYRSNLNFYHPGSLDNFQRSRAYTYGQLTPTSDLPASGAVSYDLAAMGSYYAGAANRAASKVLVGTGNLTADFTRNITANNFPLVDLNLDIIDLNGADFVNITVNDLRIADENTDNFANMFYISESAGTRVIMDYAASTGLTDENVTINSALTDAQAATSWHTYMRGYFFGPNAEEVGGGLCSPCVNGGGRGPNPSVNDDFLSLSFIGKQ